MSGVPMSEATSRDFIMVRAALVKRLGGANEALVWSRVYFRVGPDSPSAYELDGEHWWAASLQTIADETGLTVKQVRTALDGLIEGGFLAREQHAGYDRTSSYRPILHLPSGADGSALQGKSMCPPGQIDVPAGADVPLIEELETSSGEEDEKPSAKPSKRKPETRLPKSWAPTAAHIERARERRIDLLAEAEAFRLHAETHDRHAASWNAAFTTWLMKAVPGTAPTSSSPVAIDSRRDAWLAARGITLEEYLERKDEPGWLASLEAQVRRAS